MSDKQQMRSVIILLMVIALAVSGTFAILLLSDSDDPSDDVVRDSFGEMRGGDFILNSIRGPVSLKQFRGQAVLLFFGYTHCPDVCPTTMNNVADAMSLLSNAEQERVQPLFVTVDPKRDTVQHLAKYVGFFHPRIIGLSGSESQVKKAAEVFSVQFFRDDFNDAGKDNYYVNHTSYLFLIDPEGKTVDLMSEHTDPNDIAAAVRRYISE